MVRIRESHPSDRVFRAVADPLRREMLCLLHVQDDDVASVTGMGNRLSTPHDAMTEEMAATLRHVHAPKLQEEGLIDYDARSGEIRYQESGFFSRLLEYDLVECTACNRTATTTNE